MPPSLTLLANLNGIISIPFFSLYPPKQMSWLPPFRFGWFKRYFNLYNSVLFYILKQRVSLYGINFFVIPRTKIKFIWTHFVDYFTPFLLWSGCAVMRYFFFSYLDGLLFKEFQQNRPVPTKWDQNNLLFYFYIIVDKMPV